MQICSITSNTPLICSEQRAQSGERSSGASWPVKELFHSVCLCLTCQRDLGGSCAVLLMLSYCIKNQGYLKNN